MFLPHWQFGTLRLDKPYVFSGISNNTTLTSCSGIASGAGTFVVWQSPPWKLVLESAARGVARRTASSRESDVQSQRYWHALINGHNSPIFCEKSKGGGIVTPPLELRLTGGASVPLLLLVSLSQRRNTGLFQDGVLSQSRGPSMDDRRLGHRLQHPSDSAPGW